MSDKKPGSNQPPSDHEQYNRGGLIAFLFSMIFVLLFFVYVSFFHPGVDLKENLQIAQKINAAEPEVDVTKIAEPWAPNDDMVKYGKKVFAQNCALCHGNEGKGDGPAGQALNPRPRNLVEGPWKKGGGFIGWYTVLQEGLPPSAMISFAHLKPVDRWALVQFINSITKAKVSQDAATVAAFAKGPKGK